jgi:hypothetical protein
MMLFEHRDEARFDPSDLLRQALIENLVLCHRNAQIGHPLPDPTHIRELVGKPLGGRADRVPRPGCPQPLRT